MYGQGRQRESRERREIEQTYEAALGQERDKRQTLEEAKEARIKHLQEDRDTVEQKLKAALEQERIEMKAVIKQDRDRGLEQSKKILQEDHCEMEKKLEAALQQALTEKEQETNAIKVNHSIERTKIAADYQRQVDRARRDTHNLRETIEQDRNKAKQVLDTLRAAHREERRETRVLHEHQIDHLYSRIVSLEANIAKRETQGGSTLLLQGVNPSPIDSASSRMTENRIKNENEANYLIEANADPNKLPKESDSVDDLKVKIKNLRRLNAEQSNTIRDLHNSLAILSRQFEEFRATHMYPHGNVFPFAGPPNQFGVPSFPPIRPPPGPLPQQQWLQTHQNHPQGQLLIPQQRPTYSQGAIGSHLNNPVMAPPTAAHIRQQFMDQVHQTSTAQKPTDEHAHEAIPEKRDK